MKRNNIYVIIQILLAPKYKRIYIKKYNITQFLLCILIAVLAIFNGCSSTTKLVSNRQDGDIVIDGKDTEWQRGLYYNKESDFVYGIHNDDDYVYLFLKTQNRSMQRQILSSGFTVWFDANGGKSYNFGIRYPIGRKEAALEFRRDNDKEQGQIFFDQLFPELEILGPQKDDIRRFTIIESPGIGVKIGKALGALIYELRVPLKKTSDHPFAVGANPKDCIGIGFVTTESKPEGSKRDMHPHAGFGSDDKMEGEEHQSRGHAGKYRGGTSTDQGKSENLDLWFSVQLSTASPSKDK